MMAHEEILKLISQGETKKAIDALLEAARMGNKEIYEEAVHLSAKYEAYKRDERAGSVSKADQDIRLNQINSVLIELVHNLMSNKSVIGKDIRMVRSQGRERSFNWNALFITLALLAFAMGIGFVLKQEPEVNYDTNTETAAIKEDSTSITRDTGSEPPSPSVKLKPAGQPPPSGGNGSEKKPPPSVFDTLTVIVNSQEAIILIDEKEVETLTGSSLNVRRIVVPGEAKQISLITGRRKCTRALKALPRKIYENQICQN